MLRALMAVVAVFGLVVPTQTAQPGNAALRAGAKVFVNAMPDEFDSYLKAALAKKNVPLTVVESKDDADLEMTGTSESQKASAAKKLFKGSWHSAEQASVSLVDIASGEIVFAYSVNKKDSAHGKQSTAEACAKHIRDEIEKHK
jgi:hypothetical protein